MKLHIIAGQMSTESMNNTDTFYTLTGRSGEIFSGEKVRVSLMSTPRTELSSESTTPTAGSLCLSKNFSTEEEVGSNTRKGHIGEWHTVIKRGS